MKTLIRQLSALHSGIGTWFRAARRRRSYLSGFAGALLVSSLGACSRPSEPAPPAAPGATRSDQVATRPEREDTTTTAPQAAPSLPDPGSW